MRMVAGGTSRSRGDSRAGGVRRRTLAGVGVSGHGGGLYPVDAGGRPVRQAITSMDARAGRIVEGGRGRAVAATRRQAPPMARPVLATAPAGSATRQPADLPTHPLGARRQGLDGVPAYRERLDRPDRCEQQRPPRPRRRGDTTKGSSRLFGVPEVPRELPPVRESAAVVGRVEAAAAVATGIPAGTPVIAGMCDVSPVPWAREPSTRSSYSLIAGTWNINSRVRRAPARHAATMKASLGPDAGRLAYVESSATSAGNLAWFLGRIEEFPGFGPRRAARNSTMRINGAVDGLPAGAEGIAFLPFIHRSHIAPETDAAFVGMRAEHGLPHMHAGGVRGRRLRSSRPPRAARRGRARARPGGALGRRHRQPGLVPDLRRRLGPAGGDERRLAGGCPRRCHGRRGWDRTPRVIRRRRGGDGRSGRRYVPDPGRAAAYEEGYSRFREAAARFAACRVRCGPKFRRVSFEREQ